MQEMFGFYLPERAAYFIVTFGMFTYFLGVWLGYRWGLRNGQKKVEE